VYRQSLEETRDALAETTALSQKTTTLLNSILHPTSLQEDHDPITPVLTAVRKVADQTNIRALEKLQGDLTVFTSTDTFGMYMNIKKIDLNNL
jgi:hypothetical protein